MVCCRTLAVCAGGYCERRAMESLCNDNQPNEAGHDAKLRHIARGQQGFVDAVTRARSLPGGEAVVKAFLSRPGIDPELFLEVYRTHCESDPEAFLAALRQYVLATR